MNISIGNIVNIKESIDIRGCSIDKKYLGQRGIVKEINEDRPSPITVFFKDIGEDSFWEEELEFILDYNFADDEPDYSKGPFEEYFKAFDFYYAAEMKKSKESGEGLVVGKVFSLPIADGSAYYEITKVYKTKVHIECRLDLCPDKWMDRILGEGGSFPRNMIEDIVVSQKAFDKFFS